MRSAILVLVTVLLLALGFGAYWALQPSRKAHHHLQSTTAPDQAVVGKENGLSGIWIVNYDKETGDIASRFRADDYIPEKDGRDRVTRPRAQFVLKSSRQVLEIRGEWGDVSHNNTSSQSAGGLATPQTDMPSRGELHDVTVYLYPNLDILDYDPAALAADPASTAPAPPQPSVTITMSNASFDTESYRIQTEPEPKLHLKADEIDVFMTGDYDFHGKGLKIYWNDRDHRLQLLEIAHGDFLTINHPEKLGHAAAPGTPLQPTSQPQTRGDDFEPVLLVDASMVATSEAVRTGHHRAHPPQVTSRPTIAANEEPTTYRAIFLDNVHVYQGGKEIVLADKMSLDFLMKNGAKASTQPSSEPTTQETGDEDSGDVAAPQRRGGKVAGATTSPATQLASLQPATEPATEPTTQPAQPPITIRWTGMLRVVPLATPVDAGMPPGAAVVRFDGSPVIAHQQASTQPSTEPAGIATVDDDKNSSEIKCGVLIYRTQDQSLTAIQQSPGLPVLLTDPKGMNVRTPQLDYSQADHIAVLTGKGDAKIPVAPTTAPSIQPDVATTQPVEIMSAAWSHSCTLTFVPGHGSQLLINTADIKGDVDVDHPRLKLKSKELQMAFEPVRKTTSTQPATEPSVASTEPARPLPTEDFGSAALSRLVASGDVHCVTLDTADRKKSIDCDTLSLDTATSDAGKLYAHRLDAYGNVHAVDPDQDLRTNDLHTVLGPATRPASTTPASSQPADASDMFSGGVQLQRATANGNVHVITKTGAVATADEMVVETRDSKPTVRFLSSTGDARLVDKGSILVGQNILLDPGNQQLVVSGPGTMHWVKTETPGASPRVLDVQWSQNLDANFRKDLIVVLGDVVGVTTDPDGTINHAKGDRAIITTTQPATQPTTAVTRPATQTVAQNSSTQPTSRPVGDGNLFGNKVVHTITFEDDAEVKSQLLGPSGELLRRLDLQSSVIRFEQDFVADGIVKKLDVPRPGRMLVEDYRKPEEKTPSAQQPKEGSGDHKGASAFTWDDNLTYDSSTHLAIMTGLSPTGVHVVYESKTDSTKPFDMTGSRVTAELIEIVPLPTNPTASTATPITTTHPTSQPTTKPAGDHLELQKLTADGQVVFTAADGNQILADHMTYNPITHIISAHGTPRVPVVFTNVQGLESITADEVEYNAALALPKFKNIHSRMRMNVPTTHHAQEPDSLQ